MPSSSTTAENWKAKLERLRVQKQEEKKKKQEEDKVTPDEEVRKSFAPSTGIKKDTEGKIHVSQQEAVKAKQGE